ncbi:hypothetical protein GCM10023212_39880 [Luteolibacter yonseiensis]
MTRRELWIFTDTARPKSRVTKGFFMSDILIFQEAGAETRWEEVAMINVPRGTFDDFFGA